MNKYLRSILLKNDLIDNEGNIKSDDGDHFLKCISDALDEKEKDFKELEADREKFKVILDTTPCTISWLNKDMTYSGVNKALADLTDLDAEEFIGKSVGFFTDNKYYYNFVKKVFESKAPAIYQEIESEIGDELRRFWVSATKFDQGKQAVVIGIDITDLNNMKEHVMFNEKLAQLGEMVASIIHEVNNPLTMIRMQGQRLEKLVESGENEKILLASEKIVTTSDKISQIIRGVKSFMRHGQNDEKQIIKLREVIEDAVVICAGKLKKSDITMSIEDSEDVQLNINVTQVFQIFVNLITNSIDAVEGLEEKWIKVNWALEDDKVIINFIDSGKGISKTIEKAMWNSFFTTKSVGKGMGLGLSLCKRIMEDHKGKICIDSKQAQTTFVIEFPLN